MANKDDYIHIRISSELKERIKDQCYPRKLTGMKISELVESAVIEKLEKIEK